MQYITDNNGGKNKKNSDERKTTIQICVSTRKELLELGKKGETYDDILRRLIDFYKKNSATH